MSGFELIWAEKYDRVLEDIFAVQEEVTECIVAAIAPQIDAVESLRARRRPGNLSAYELALRAVTLGYEPFHKSDLAARNEALRLARAALAVDAESVVALNAVAFAQWQHVALRTAADPQAAWQQGMDAAMRGIEIARSNTRQTMKAMLLGYAPSGGRWEEARLEAQIAYRLNPQDSQMLTGCAVVHINAGDPVEAVRLLERSLRINPRDPNAPFTHSNLSYAYFAAREYRKGLEWAVRAKNGAPGHASAHQNMAVLLVGLGEIDRARESLEVARRLEPKYIDHRLKARPAGHGSELRHRFDTFLRVAAGLEDPRAADTLR